MAILSTSCSSDFPQEPLAHTYESRSVTPGTESETNPTLLADWENCDYIIVNDHSSQRVTPPWGSGSSGSLETNFKTDIKKDHGWLMLFHTFCRANADFGLNYMCFYNFLTGYFKVFYYANESDSGSTTVWGITNGNEEISHSLFADYDYFSNPLEGASNSTIWSITEDNRLTGETGLTRGWNGFEFRVGEYHPSISTSSLNFKAYNTMYSAINGDASITTHTTGTISTINSNDISILNNAIAKGIFSLGGDKAKGEIDKHARSLSGKKILGLDVSQLLSKIKADDYADAIKSGVGLLYKILFKKGPSYSVSDVKLQTEGTIKLSASSQTSLTSSANPLSLINLDDILTGRAPALSTNSSIAVQSSSDISLGIWNLKNKPTIYYDRYTEFLNLIGIPEPGCGLLDFNGFVKFPNTYVGDVEIVFNPAIQPYVKSYYVSLGMLDIIGGNRQSSSKNKPTIKYNYDNRISNYETITTYGVSEDTEPLFGFVDYVTTPIDDGTKLYIDWGTDVTGYRAAVVGLTWEIEYKGATYSFSESRIYDVNYKPSPYSKTLREVNNPPSTMLLNHENYSGFNLNGSN